MAPIKVGFLGFGEVASVFSKAMLAHGAEVAACDIRPKPCAEGVRFLSLPDLLAGVDCVLSTVTTREARKVADDCAAWLKRGQIYLDLNSTSPAVKMEIARAISGSGADFVEGAILGAVGASGAATRILIGGERGEEAAATLCRLGLNASFYSREIGKASLFKMLRSIFSKGMEALILELLISGRRAGIEEDLWQDVADFMAGNPFDRIAENWVRTHPTASERRYHEMVQVREAIRELGLSPLMTAATESFFDRSRALDLAKAFPEKPRAMGEVVAFLEQRLGRV